MSSTTLNHKDLPHALTGGKKNVYLIAGKAKCCSAQCMGYTQQWRFQPGKSTINAILSAVINFESGYETQAIYFDLHLIHVD